MFSVLSVRMTLMFFRVMFYVADMVEAAQNTRGLAGTLPKGLAFLLANPPAGGGNDINPNCGDPVVTKIQAGVTQFVHVLIGVGISIAVIGIVVGGLMRATSFGNERRVAMSNTAITCSIVGLVVVILGATVGNTVPLWFGQSQQTVDGCQIH